MLLLLLACSPSPIKLGDDTAGNGTDTATATGTTTGGTSTVMGDSAPVSDAGDYSGTIAGVVTYNGRQGSGQENCDGNVEITISESDDVSGTIQCDIPRWNWSYYGEVTGTNSGGAVDGNWAVDFGYGQTYDIALSGTVGDGALDLTAYVDWGQGNTVEAEISAQR